MKMELSYKTVPRFKLINNKLNSDIMWNCITTTSIFRRNQECREKIKSLYNKYHHRYNITYGDYYITINGVSYGCKKIDEIEIALKEQDVRLDTQVRIK